MSIKKYTDWYGWWLGLRKNLLKCIGTTGVAWLGTNALAGTGMPIHGIDWEQAIAMFGVHIGFEIFTYLSKVEPEVITESVETTSKTVDSAGVTTTAASKMTTETPIEQKPQ